MELISNQATTISGNVPKIVETPNNLIINTQVYDKATLQPLPMKFSAYHTQFIHLLLKTRIDWNNDINESGKGAIIYCHKVSNQPSLWISKKDPNKFYTLARYHNGFTYGDVSFYDDVILRYMSESEDNEISYLQSVCPYNNYGLNYDNSANNRTTNDLNIICETDNYFIAERKAQKYETGGTNNPYAYSCSQLLRINKTSLTSYTIVLENYIHSAYMGYGSSLENSRMITDYYYYLESKPNSEIVYLLARWKSNLVVYKYDAITNTLTTLFTYSNNNYRTISNAVKIGDYYYALVDNYVAGDTIEHKYGFLKFRLNIDTDTVTEEIISIDIGSYSEMVTRDYMISVVNSLETFTVNNKNYIICTMFATNYLQSAIYHFHATMRLEDDGTFIVTDYIPFSIGCRGVLYYIQPTTCVFLLKNSFAFYTFDSTAEKYVPTYVSPGIYKTIGFDMLNRFYALSTDYAVEMLTYYSPAVLKADFKDEIYDKTDSEAINTTVSIYAKNFTNEYINTNVTLALIGDVVFTDNGEKTIETNTSDAGVKEIPVIINGSGRIQVLIAQTT